MSRLWSKVGRHCGVFARIRRCSLDEVSKYSYETNLKWLRSLYLIEIRVYFIDVRLIEVSLLDHLWAIGGGYQSGDIGRDALGRNWLKGRIRPVLKHGPRSLTCMRIKEWQTQSNGVKANRRKPLRPAASRKAVVLEFTWWDPKDVELSLNRTKSGEILMEVRSDTDVQIVRLIWV